MKNILVMLGLTSVLLTGCNSGAGDHDVQKVVDQVSKQPVPTQLKNLGKVQNNANQSVPLKAAQPNHTAGTLTLPLPASSRPKITSENASKKANKKVNKNGVGQGKQEQPEQELWISKHQDIVGDFEDAGFTEKQVHDICKLYNFQGYETYCDHNGWIDNQFVSRFIYRSQYSSGGNPFQISVIYIPKLNRLILEKQRPLDSSNGEPLLKVNEVEFNREFSDRVKVSKVGTDGVKVVATLDMNDDVTRALKDKYTNLGDDVAIESLAFDNSKTHLDIVRFTEDNGNGKVDINNNDLNVLNYYVREILKVAAK